MTGPKIPTSTAQAFAAAVELPRKHSPVRGDGSPAMFADVMLRLSEEDQAEILSLWLTARAARGLPKFHLWSLRDAARALGRSAAVLADQRHRGAYEDGTYRVPEAAVIVGPPGPGGRSGWTPAAWDRDEYVRLSLPGRI